MPLSQAELRGIPRFNPNIPEHVLAAQGEEALANAVHAIPDEQVITWGDPIGANGADLVSVDRRTGEVTLWDAKYRSGDVRIQHSSTFQQGENVRSNARLKAILKAERAVEKDTTLPPEVRQKALLNLVSKRVQTRTVGYGNAKNSTIGN